MGKWGNVCAWIKREYESALDAICVRLSQSDRCVNLWMYACICVGQLVSVTMTMSCVNRWERLSPCGITLCVSLMGWLDASIESQCGLKDNSQRHELCCEESKCWINEIMWSCKEQLTRVGASSHSAFGEWSFRCFFRKSLSLGLALRQRWVAKSVASLN